MKNVIALLALVAVVTFVSSCEVANVDSAELTAQETSVANARAAADSLATSTDSVRHGKRHNHVAFDLAKLPQAAKDYIAKNYVGYTLVSAHTHANDTAGQIAVVATATDGTSKVIVFTAAGVFVQEKVKGSKGEFAHTEIAVADLPAVISAYITTNYAGFTVYKAFKDVNNAIHVVIKDATTAKVVKFDATNAFVEVKDKAGKGKGKKG